MRQPARPDLWEARVRQPPGPTRQGEQVELGGLRLRIEQGDRLEEVERERLVHREVFLQVDVDADPRALGRPGNDLHDATADQGAEELPAALEVSPFRVLRLVAVADERLHGAPAV